MARVPFVDLKQQGLELLPEYQELVASVVGRAAYVMGPEMKEFEAAFAEYCGCPFAQGVASGTDALALAYRAAGIGAGDEVIVPTNTFTATAEAVVHAGATPVLVDCLESTANIDPAGVEAAITGKTKAIVPVHLFGQPADMDAVNPIATKHGLLVIEDACQAHGATYKGRPTGSLGDLAAFSFYPGKNLGALGDAGAITTADADVVEQIRILRNHGDKGKSDHVVVGYCSRMDNLQAGFLKIKLAHLPEWNRARRHAAKRYDALFADMAGVTPFKELADVEAVYHLYVVQVDDRDGVKARLNDLEVDSGVHYPVPVHLQPSFAYLGYKEGDFPVAERLAGRILSLPMFPDITDAQVDFVAEQLAKAVKA